MRRGNGAGLGAASTQVAMDPIGITDFASPRLDSDAELDGALRSLPKRFAPRDLVDRIMARAERETDRPAG